MQPQLGGELDLPGDSDDPAHDIAARGMQRHELVHLGDAGRASPSG